MPVLGVPSSARSHFSFSQIPMEPTSPDGVIWLCIGGFEVNRRVCIVDTTEGRRAICVPYSVLATLITS
jgi:hypothetical protein